MDAALRNKPCRLSILAAGWSDMGSVSYQPIAEALSGLALRPQSQDFPCNGILRTSSAAALSGPPVQQHLIHPCPIEAPPQLAPDGSFKPPQGFLAASVSGYGQNQAIFMDNDRFHPQALEEHLNGSGPSNFKTNANGYAPCPAYLNPRQRALRATQVRCSTMPFIWETHHLT